MQNEKNRNPENAKKRKQKNLEIERSKKQRSLVVKSIFAIIALAVLGASGLWIWSWLDGRTIMHFHGERVAESDFHFVTLMSEMEGVQPSEESHAFALESLVQTLMLLQRGEMHGLSVSDEDMTMLEEQAAGFRQQMQWHPTRLNFISDRRIAEIWSAEPMYDLLMDVYLPDFELSAEELAELEEDVAEHLEEVRIFLVDREVKFAAAHNTEWHEFEMAVSAYNEGDMDFDALIREISIYYEGEIEAVDFWEFFDEHELWRMDEWDELLEYDEGETSHVFAVDEMLFIMHVVSAELDEEAVADEEYHFREHRVRSERVAIFNEMIEEWTDAAFDNVVTNDRAMRRALRRSISNTPNLEIGTPAAEPMFDMDMADFMDSFELDLSDLLME
ncbi:MAG: hypothetical protein FWF80_06200 [Defluviitaleaceae bacterium]|nr:hypothetical protein [Defluviitaleaceae bacterium]